MMSRLFLAAFAAAISSQAAWAQQAPTDAARAAIMREGLALYHSERASWVATDLLQAQKMDMQQLQGYLSYADGDSTRTVFFVRSAPADAPLRMAYAYAFPTSNISPATAKPRAARPANAQEQQLFAARQAVYDELRSGTKLGTPYRFPANTSPNVVLLPGQPLKAYVLTGPREPVLPIGNDFLMVFGPDGRSIEVVERLHNSYLPMQWKGQPGAVSGGMHSHLAAHPYITPTDICSLLLYRELFPAGQHYVIGQDYVSVFDLTKPELIILTRQAWDKIYKQKDAKQ